MLYAGSIPLVPLLGAQHYARRADNVRRNVCYGIFALQLLVSATCIFQYLRG